MNAPTPPGWYHAEGDPPGTQRYWSGSEWVGDPVAVSPGATPPPAAGGPTPFGGGPYAGAPPGWSGPAFTPMGVGYAESSQATTSLVLSIVGLFLMLCCIGVVFCGIGAALGYQEMQAIDAGRRDPANRGVAKAGYVTGLIGVCIFALLFVLNILGTVAAPFTAL